MCFRVILPLKNTISTRHDRFKKVDILGVFGHYQRRCLYILIYQKHDTAGATQPGKPTTRSTNLD